MIYRFLRFLSWVSARIYLNLKVYGAVHVPKKGGFLVAANHASYLDPVIIGVACPRDLNYMARHDLFRNAAFAELLRQLHVFPVKRATADISAIKEAIRRVHRGGGLLLFPEGSRTNDGNLQQAQAGIGFLAAKLGVPVVPAYVKGTYQSFPKGSKRIKSAPVTVRFGKAIDIDQKTAREATAVRIMQHIRMLEEQ
jgi:1-acyl-sn-glycerol-3-phosphate acyltransferase